MLEFLSEYKCCSVNKCSKVSLWEAGDINELTIIASVGHRQASPLIVDVLYESVRGQRHALDRVRAGTAHLSTPIIFVLVDDGRSLDIGVNDERSKQRASADVELLRVKHTLSELEVRATKSLDNPVLEGAIGVVEALVGGTS